MIPKFYRVTDESDFDNYFRLKSDPSAIVWSGFSGTPDKIKLQAHFEKIILDKNNFLYFLQDSETNTIIGYIQFEKYNATEATYLGTSIHSDYQGNGYGKLITDCMIKAAVDENISKLSGYCSVENVASIKNLLFFGFVKSDVLPKSVFVPGLNKEIIFNFYEKYL